MPKHIAKINQAKEIEEKADKYRDKKADSRSSHNEQGDKGSQANSFSDSSSSSDPETENMKIEESDNFLDIINR